MTDVNMCPELHYRRTPQGLTLTACYGVDGCIYLPDEIEGEPITAIAPYAFSESHSGGFAVMTTCNLSDNDTDLVYLTFDADFVPERRRLVAEEVIEVHLPRYVREIGHYAFYRCRNMRKLTFHGGLPSIGGGALTGCRFQEVEIYLHDDEKSALKSILDEIRFAVHVRFHYETSKYTSEILFPEHYEEAVENTPARILYTSHHGAGGYYRQCFYNRELDYKKYDELLPWAIAEEEEETVVRLAFLRLVFPYRLSETARGAYETYMKEHIETVAGILIEEEDTEKFDFLSKHHYWTEESLNGAIECAGNLGKTEILSVLMAEKYRNFKEKKKTFEL